MMDAVRLAAVPRPTRFRYAMGWRLTRGIRLAIKALLVVAGLVAVAPVVLVAAGYQPSVLRTESMEPTMTKGDIVVTETVSSGAIVAGDVVTFTDSARDGDRFTERVLVVAPSTDGVAFATRSDSSPTVHQWTIPEQQRINRVAHHLPATSPAMRAVTSVADRPLLVTGVLVALLAVAVIRRLAR
jgi:signal peptidase I